MEAAIEAIRTALTPDANEEQRLTGVGACRAILSVLDPTPAEAAPTDARPPEPTPNVEAPAPREPAPPPVAQVVAAMRGLPAEQLLDLAIARLRAALPSGTRVPNVQPLKLQLIPLPVAGRPRK